MPALGEALVARTPVQLAVGTLVPGWKNRKERICGITHYGIAIRKSRIGYDAGKKPSIDLIERCASVVDDFAPDIVHIHGTETLYGWLAASGYIERPTVISIQGIVSSCARYYTGALPFSGLLKASCSLEWLLGRSILQEQRKWYKRGKLEDNVIRRNKCFIGRTRWDRAHVLALNPNAQYFHCEELMRPPFYMTSWSLDKCDRHTIFCSSGSYPLKGFHWLIRAVAVLRNRFPDVRLRVADALPKGRSTWKGYNRYLRGLLDELRLADCVEPLGLMSAEQMAEELTRAHVYVIPSLIENSPNSLVEAMLVGTPSVASLCGGIPSMVNDGVNSLCFLPGDEVVMAECIREIFVDDALAQHLSAKASVFAHTRNNPDSVVAKMMEIYALVATAKNCEANHGM